MASTDRERSGRGIGSGARRRSGRLAVVVGAAAALALSGGAAGDAGTGSLQARWVIHDLGTWLGGKESEAVAINERGQVIVLSDTATRVVVGEPTGPVRRAFLWQDGSLRDLGARFGGPGSSAVAISERGQVVGAADTEAVATSGHHVTHAFSWQNGVTRDLGVLGYTARPRLESSYAVDVNERGQVAGASCRDVGRACRAFLWQNGKPTDLGTLGGAQTDAVAIDGLGRIVGTGTTGATDGNRSPIRHAFLWRNGTLTDLGTLGGPRSYAADVNDRGRVVGMADTKATSRSGWFRGSPIRHAFLWQDGTMRDLGTLGGEYSSAFAINGHGQVVGWAFTGKADHTHAFLWSGGRMRDLGTLVENGNSQAFAVNDGGQVVGSASTGMPNRSHAFVWQSGRMTDLGTLGGRSSTAWAITESGQIVGWARTKSGARHAVLWTLERPD